jgi:hypothetical protein
VCGAEGWILLSHNYLAEKKPLVINWDLNNSHYLIASKNAG